MAVVNTPIFVQSSALAHVQISTANTNRDGTGTLGTLATGDGDGTVIDYLRAVATGTTTAGVVRIFLSTDGGTNKRLIKEILVSAITPGTATEVWTGEWIPTRPLVLKDSNSILYASTHNAETFNVSAHGANF